LARIDVCIVFLLQSSGFSDKYAIKILSFILYKKAQRNLTTAELDGFMFFSKSSLAYNQDRAKSSRQGVKLKTLKIRTQYQAAVAELGLQALSGIDLNTLFNDAVNIITRTLNVQYVSVLEVLSNGKSLIVVAGIEQYKIYGKALVDVSTNLEISYVLNSNQSVFLDNLRTESRPISPRLQKYNLVSGMLVALPNQDRALGILEVYTNHPRVFSKEDLHFLQAVANVLATAIDHQRSNNLLLAQSHVLELIATGATLSLVLDSMCRLLEQLSPSAYCSILLLDSQTNQLRSGAAPSLPPEYAAAFDRLMIGDSAGSCGTAAYRGESVFVEDIGTDPLWAKFRDFALFYNIRSCWSIPFFSQSGKVLGTFAISHSSPCLPTNHHQALMKIAAHLASIATQRQQSEQALKQANEQLESRVAERTNQLREATEYLLVEVAERKMAELALRQSEGQLKDKAQHLEQAYGKLQQAQAQLIQNEKMASLGQLVAGVAHEINNPVNFIQGNVTHATQYTQDLIELLKLYQTHYPDSIVEIEEKAAEIGIEFLFEDLPKLFASMEVGANRICEIVQSLRNFSHLDEAEVKAVDIHEGINSTLMILKSRLKAQPKRPIIQVVKEYGELPLIECYAGQLNQVFMNILINAIDALEEAIELEAEAIKNQLCCLAFKNPTIWIRTEIVNSNLLRVQIIDNGLGIPEHIQHRLFDPFFTTKPVGKGTGMGMSISYQIITERHKGQLLCSSKLGQGANFIIEIPLQPETL
jgi:signal transduction histidine kinase